LKQQALEPKMLWPGELWQSVQTAGAFSWVRSAVMWTEVGAGYLDLDWQRTVSAREGTQQIVLKSRTLLLAVSSCRRGRDYRSVFSKRVGNVNKPGSELLIPRELQFREAEIE
jgi:hypothetical protein